MTSQTSELVERLTRPIIGIENRSALEVFDIMCDRFRRALELSSSEVTEEMERVAASVERATEKEVPYWDGILLKKIARAAITAMRSAATSERKG